MSASSVWQNEQNGNLWNLVIGVISWAGITVGLSVLIRAINDRNEQ